MSAIEKTSPMGLAPSTFSDVARMAKALSTARGFVPREMLDNPNAIAACILTGAELGIGPMQSLRSIYVIDGRPMLSADLMLALAIRRGVRPQWVRSDGEVAHLRLTRDGFEPHEHTFTLREAEAAGLAGRGNWKKYAPAMLRARCLSAALRAYAPDVIGPGVYVEGEIVDDDAPAPVVRHEPAEVVDEPRALPAPKLPTAQQLEAMVRRTASELLRDGTRMARAVEIGAALGLDEATVRGWAAPVEAPEAAE